MTRRREMARLPTNDTNPCISSSLTFSSPSIAPLAALKRNTSPLTVPVRDSGPAPPSGIYPPRPNSTDPLTFSPCCSSSNRRSPGELADPPVDPDQVPVTSTVTRVRSIQSCFAHPEPITSVVAMRSPSKRFIAACGRERSGRAAIRSRPCGALLPVFWRESSRGSSAVGDCPRPRPGTGGALVT